MPKYRSLPGRPAEWFKSTLCANSRRSRMTYRASSRQSEQHSGVKLRGAESHTGQSRPLLEHAAHAASLASAKQKERDATMCGGVRVTSTPPIAIEPSSGAIRPAINRSSVVLPQPEGPSRVTSAPRSTARSTRSSTVAAPKRFERFVVATCAFTAGSNGPPIRRALWRRTPSPGRTAGSGRGNPRVSWSPGSSE